MTSLRFWQKIYLTALALFLLCLNAGVFGVCIANKRQSDEAVKRQALTQQQVLIRQFTSDLYETQRTRPLALSTVYENAVRNFGNEGFLLEIRQNGITLNTNLPEYEGERPEMETAPGQRSSLVRKTERGEFLVITSMLSGELEGYCVTAMQNIGKTEAEWQKTIVLCTFLSGCVSCLLAVMLYAALARVSHPLMRLARTVESFATGNREARAPAGRGGDEIALLARSFNRMAEQTQQDMLALQDAADEKQQLVDALSHELRTPLTAIHGYAEYIQRAQLTEQELYEATDYIMSESHRLELVANQMLNLAVLRTDTLEAERVSLPDLLRTIYRTVMPKAGRRGVRITVERPSAAFIHGNAPLLESLLVNLADNGVKACDQGGLVTITSRVCADTVLIQVSDTGHGMTPEQLSKIGQPFYRADKARSRAEGGAGLGLSLCFQIVQAHGGTLQFQSVPGQGTTAMVTLPREDAR